MGMVKRAFLVGLTLLLAAGCEQKARTHGSGSASLTGSTDTVESSWAPTTAYRFISADQTLADARKALAEERWADAAGAAEAMLKNHPDNADARAIDDKAKLEGPNQIRFGEYQKVAAANDMLGMAKFYRQLGDGSQYKEKARPGFEKARDAWIDSQTGDARAFMRAGRCDEARRVARVTAETFAETRGALENIAGACHPRDKVIAGAATATEKPERHDEQRSPDPPVTASATPTAPAPVAENKPVQVADSKPAPTLTASVADKPAPPAPAPAGIVAAPPPPPRAASVASKNVSPAELESLRIAGEKNPTLSAGAKQIAHRDGVKIIQMAVAVCVNDRGQPTSVNMKLSSDYSDANEKLLRDVRAWRFRPYLANGQPTPVCSGYVFRYVTN